MDVTGKIALVTGGAKRLGLAMADALARRGVDVALHFGRSQPEADAAVRRFRGYGVRAAAFQAELTDPQQVAQLVPTVAETFGGLDILINNAAIFERHPFSDLTDDAWNRTLAVNLTAPYACARRAGEIMLRRGGGKIVNLACVGGMRPWPSYISYCVSKAGLIMLTETLARALAPLVQVNAIAPGVVDLDDPPPDADGAVLASAPPKNAASEANAPQSADIVRALIYLLESDCVTGETLVVDGGRRLR
jgi:pteridine reductase